MDEETQRRAVWCELVSETVRAKGEARLKVAGASMLPTVWPGDLVVVRHCNFADLRPGEIILHGHQEKLTLHRIERIAEDHLLARGDSLPCYDPPVAASEVLGRAVRILRRGRNVDLEQSFWGSLVGLILRRSRLLRRATVYAYRRMQRSRDAHVVPLSPSPLPAAKQ